MTTLTIHEAETDLAQLIARAEAGEEIVIARDEVPVAKLTGLSKHKKPLYGALAGLYPVIPDAFFLGPLPEDELKLWEGDNEDLSR